MRAARTSKATPEEREAIVRMTKRGYTARRIAEETGLTERSVQRQRVALGIAKSGGRRFTAEERARILEMIEDECPLPEIARTIGRSPDVIRGAYRGMSTARPLGHRAYQLRKQLGLA